MDNIIFKQKSFCNENISWALNGSVLVLTSDEVSDRLCSFVELQKFVLTIPQTSTISDSQQNALIAALSNNFSIDPSRINVTQPPNTELVNKNGQLIFSLSSSNDTSEAETSSLIFNITQMFSNSTVLKNFLSSTSINTPGVVIKTLTFNETVGTLNGCYATDGGGGLSLLLDVTDVTCANNKNTDINSGSSSYSGPSDSSVSSSSISVSTIVAVVVAIFSSVVIVVVIFMIIPGTRYAIFPKLKVRHQIKQRIKNDDTKN